MQLMSTWGCHLCEDAQLLLQQAGLLQYCQVLDIVDHPELFERYRVHIPVLVDGERELFWPFNLIDVQHFGQQTK
ncbi:MULTISPECIES: glutaredoxin family protein [Rheinheimera]|uniref:Glutaredoxin family protein n=1 Tax=Rheinheimera marina TaxID=1774958 RepID=A0ABV9JJD2_9GAMM